MERPEEVSAARSRAGLLGPTLSPGRHTTRPRTRQPSKRPRGNPGPADAQGSNGRPHARPRPQSRCNPELTSA